MRKEKKYLHLLVFITIICFIFIFISCSQEKKVKTSQEITDSKVTQTTEQEPVETDTAKNSETTEETAEVKKDTTKDSGKDEDEQEIQKDTNIVVYNEKNIKIEPYYTVHEELYTGSISIEVDKNTGNLEGYVFLGYQEVTRSRGTSNVCENVMKGSITGSLDDSTNEINCEINSEFSGEGNNCFSGTITLELVGKLIEDGELIKGIFMLPSGNQLSFLLEKDT